MATSLMRLMIPHLVVLWTIVPCSAEPRHQFEECSSTSLLQSYRSEVGYQRALQDEQVTLDRGSKQKIKFLVWNIQYENKDIRSIAEIITPNEADIVGINELWFADASKLAKAISDHNRKFKLQPGFKPYLGFGTVIYYNSNRFKLLDGGMTKVSKCKSKQGDRAANWVVLKDRESGVTFITGGIHLSYCSDRCDKIHECELGVLYDKFEAAKTRYNNPPVMWMGDLNSYPEWQPIPNLKKGVIGKRRVFKVTDMARTNDNTHYTGENKAIDHILGEKSGFKFEKGGRTGQGRDGQRLHGSDHFPVYSLVQIVGNGSPEGAPTQGPTRQPAPTPAPTPLAAGQCCVLLGSLLSQQSCSFCPSGHQFEWAWKCPGSRRCKSAAGDQSGKQATSAPATATDAAVVAAT